MPNEPEEVLKSVAIAELDAISVPLYAALIAFAMAVICPVESFFGSAAPEYTSDTGLYELADFNAFPLNRRVPESVLDFSSTELPAVTPLFVSMLGSAMT